MGRKQCLSARARVKNGKVVQQKGGTHNPEKAAAKLAHVVKAYLISCLGQRIQHCRTAVCRGVAPVLEEVARYMLQMLFVQQVRGEQAVRVLLPLASCRLSFPQLCGVSNWHWHCADRSAGADATRQQCMHSSGGSSWALTR